LQLFKNVYDHIRHVSKDPPESSTWVAGFERKCGAIFSGDDPLSEAEVEYCVVEGWSVHDEGLSHNEICE
jgi:hypothetical protein